MVGAVFFASKQNSSPDYSIVLFFFVSLPLHLPVAAVMSSVDDEAGGWSTTLRNKRHCTLCFW